MTLAEARELKAGQRVRWETGKDPKVQLSDPPSNGTVTINERDIVSIKWDDMTENEYPTRRLFRQLDLTEWWGNVRLLTDESKSNNS